MIRKTATWVIFLLFLILAIILAKVSSTAHRHQGQLSSRRQRPHYQQRITRRDSSSSSNFYDGLDKFGYIQPVSYSSYDDDYVDFERPTSSPLQQQQEQVRRPSSKQQQQQQRNRGNKRQQQLQKPWRRKKQQQMRLGTVEPRPWKPVQIRNQPDSGSSVTNKLLLLNALIYGLQVFKPSVTKFGYKVSDKIVNGKEYMK